jgi:D-arabinose 1-dehydrogenase-like Zn-dependent alcohol dehydrogenase
MADKQTPIGSSFDAGTTAQQALAGSDLRGKTVIVTGGYSGIGLETVRVLVDAGAQVIVSVLCISMTRNLNTAPMTNGSPTANQKPPMHCSR